MPVSKHRKSKKNDSSKKPLTRRQSLVNLLRENNDALKQATKLRSTLGELGEILITVDRHMAKDHEDRIKIETLANEIVVLDKEKQEAYLDIKERNDKLRETVLGLDIIDRAEYNDFNAEAITLGLEITGWIDHWNTEIFTRITECIIQANTFINSLEKDA